MTRQAIDQLLSGGNFPDEPGRPVLTETHISWVLLGQRFAYKIKKPIRYPFLDFSTLEKRKRCCEREILLNRRLTADLYLDVVPVRLLAGKWFVGGEGGEVADYAVRMRRADSGRQMDVLLRKGRVTWEDIRRLAQKIAVFHASADILYDKDALGIRAQFRELGAEGRYLGEELSADYRAIIGHALDVSDRFVETHKELLEERLESGFFRDCHGDLHTRNIFLLSSPQPFDCIEFNDDYRQMDVLNEVAFLCMDLDAFGRKDFSDFFLACYGQFSPAIRNDQDRILFIYYKSYRANVRAKVNSLRARSAAGGEEKKQALDEAARYLLLMDGYIREIDQLTALASK